MSGKNDDHDKSPDLTQKQLLAVECLAAGSNDRETAEEVGVTRETVTRWKNNNVLFQTEFKKRMDEVWQEARTQLDSLSGLAIKTLVKNLESGNIKAALFVLERLGEKSIAPSTTSSGIANSEENKHTIAYEFELPEESVLA